MTCVLKIGGAALESPEILGKCMQAIRDLRQQHPRLLVVHGGGSLLTRTLKKMGKESAFANGLRVTDAETRDAALMVLCGFVNKTLVAALTKAGVQAVGMSGGDGATVVARRFAVCKTTACKADNADLGFVGEVACVDTTWIEAIWAADGVPIMASMAPDDAGIYYNVNADLMATAIAAACGAEQLIFLTEVAGVLNADGQRIPHLASPTIAALIRDTVITGGMLPKMAACQSALAAGVGRVHIFPAIEAHRLAITPRPEFGTEVTLS